MRKKTRHVLLLFLLILAMTLTACGSSTDKKETAPAGKEASTGQESTAAAEKAVDETAPQIKGLTYVSTMDLQYADCYNVYYYEGGYKLVDIPLSGQYLVIPEGGEKPDRGPADRSARDLYVRGQYDLYPDGGGRIRSSPRDRLSGGCDLCVHPVHPVYRHRQTETKSDVRRHL